MTLLRRLGNKSKIAHKIIPYFPPHKIFIDVFFGAGGMFFNKPKAKYNIVNDIDSDVFNLFQVVMNQKEELEKAFYIMPIHSDLLEYWKKNKETDPIKKALRFLLLSNFGYMGRANNIKYDLRTNAKEQFNNKINNTFFWLKEVKFNNCDFTRFFSSLCFIDIDYGKPSGEKDMIFIYSDSPYLETDNNYSDSNHWTKKNVIDLFDCLHLTKAKFAYSEFNHPFILDQAKERNLNVIIIGERQNLKNRRTEILITNYEKTQYNLFD